MTVKGKERGEDGAIEIKRKMVEKLQHKSKFNCQKLIQMVTVDFYLIPFLFRDGLS